MKASSVNVVSPIRLSVIDNIFILKSV